MRIGKCNHKMQQCRLQAKSRSVSRITYGSSLQSVQATSPARPAVLAVLHVLQLAASVAGSLFPLPLQVQYDVPVDALSALTTELMPAAAGAVVAAAEAGDKRAGQS